MIVFTKFLLTSLVLGFVYSDSPPLVPGYNAGCPEDFSATCNLQCSNGNYVLDDKGCPTCVCAKSCSEIKCRANCGPDGYVLDENGCQTCKCVTKEQIQCSRVMCRMFCQYGFKRDENGCEYCACNQSPQPCPQLTCENLCLNGYRKDYSGCSTCECDCPSVACPVSLNNCKTGLKKDAQGCPICECQDDESETSINKCPLLQCDLNCNNGFQLDENGCQLCSCNICPLITCRMYCTYGFRKNLETGCEMCECDWTPVAEKIQCDERIPCPDTRVCNLNLKLCEIVNPDRVNWFLYDFEVENELFQDDKFIQTFKNGLIYNIAKKYGLEITQITVSSVEDHGLTSFQIMPFFNEDMDVFQSKMDQIDDDLNTHEFRAVLPAVVRATEDGDSTKTPSRINVNRWCHKFKNLLRSRPIILALAFVLICIVSMIIIIYINIYRRRCRYSKHSESKTAIYDDTAYHLASDDDENWQKEHISDATGYNVIATDEKCSSNDKRVMV